MCVYFGVCEGHTCLLHSNSPLFFLLQFDNMSNKLLGNGEETQSSLFIWVSTVNKIQCLIIQHLIRCWISLLMFCNSHHRELIRVKTGSLKNRHSMQEEKEREETGKRTKKCVILSWKL